MLGCFLFACGGVLMVSTFGGSFCGCGLYLCVSLPLFQLVKSPFLWVSFVNISQINK